MVCRTPWARYATMQEQQNVGCDWQQQQRLCCCSSRMPMASSWHWPRALLAEKLRAWLLLFKPALCISDARSMQRRSTSGSPLNTQTYARVNATCCWHVAPNALLYSAHMQLRPPNTLARPNTPEHQ